MEIVAEGVAVAGAHGPLLTPTSLRVRNGEPLLAAGDSATARTALALTMSGRLKPTRGTVRVNGALDARTLRNHVAVIDADGITAPEDSVRVHDVVAEGLSLAGRGGRRKAVRNWLQQQHLSDYADERFENLPATARTSLLMQLGRAARGTRMLILDSPDRHGGDPANWFALAKQQAADGLIVLALCSPHSAEKLAVPTTRVGVDNRANTQSAPESGEGTE